MSEKLTENEHTLVSPDLIGTDQEKMTSIQYWSDAVKLLRSLNTLVISYRNKQALIDAINNELKTVETEIKNSSGIPTDTGTGIPSVVQPVTTDVAKPAEVSPPPKEASVEVAINAPVPHPTEPIDLSPEAGMSESSRETLQKLAGTWSPKPKNLTPDLAKLQRMAGIK